MNTDAVPASAAPFDQEQQEFSCAARRAGFPDWLQAALCDYDWFVQQRTAWETQDPDGKYVRPSFICVNRYDPVSINRAVLKLSEWSREHAEHQRKLAGALQDICFEYWPAAGVKFQEAGNRS